MFKEIREHPLYADCLDLHKKGLITGVKDLDKAFDIKIEISRQLKTPLYDVMMAVIGDSTN